MHHDIIDNRTEKLLDHIRTILPSTERIKFAVGYLFLSGLKPIREDLERLKEIRLLIGNTVDTETMEMLAEGSKRLEGVEERLEGWRYQRRVEMKQASEETLKNFQEAISLMDQTDEDEAIIRGVARLMEEKRLKVRVYTKGRLHAKAYIFDYGPVYDQEGNIIPRQENGIAIVGSSNLTLAGLTHNTELNVMVHGNQNHAELSRWFEELWEEAQELDQVLLKEMKKSWAMAQVRPYDIYLKTLYELVRERLDEKEELWWDDEIFSDLADFQKVALRQAIQMTRNHGGCFVADVVGLGKSYIGAAVVKYFERYDDAHPLIICPKGLERMWERYNERYDLHAKVLSMGLLVEREDGLNFLLKEYNKRNFVLVDESHNFRHTDTQRYRLLQAFLSTGRKCLFLTATPRAKSAWDIYHQIKLFHQEDQIDLSIDPPYLREFFRQVESGKSGLKDLLASLLIRRTRTHILRWYGIDAETHEPVDPNHWQDYRDGRRKAYIKVGENHHFFPRRELETITYSIEEVYQGLYERLRGYLGRPRRSQASTPPDELTYARYGLWHYVKKEGQKQKPYSELHQAGANLRGLVRVMLFKRFESSVHAFRETLRRLLRIHEMFLKALKESIVPAGDEAQAILYESDQMEESQLFDELKKASGRYTIDDFNTELLRGHIEQDINILRKMLELVEAITPEKDAKLQGLKEWLSQPPLCEGKRLIFTQYADTAKYLYDNLNPNGEEDDIEVIYSGDKSRERVVGRFAPNANPWYHIHSGESELNTVIATDVLAEGLNLQDCDKVINYDLHWNPVRLIQRFGRIDRIGSEHERIFAFNFLPELGIEKQLGLREKLAHRISEIHETIGEDSAILEPTEQLNEEAMYAIYEQRGWQLSLFEEQEEEPMSLTEAEEFIRRMKLKHPEEYERVASLRDGIRTGRSSNRKGIFAFFRAGRYQQLLLLNEEGKVISRDLSEVLKVILCTPDEAPQALPQGYNATLMKAKAQFDEEVKHRRAQLEHITSLDVNQRYVLRELKTLFNASQDDEQRHQIMVLEQSFRRPLIIAVKRELSRLKRNGVTGERLIYELKRIYSQHNLRDASSHGASDLPQETPRIICSEALI